MYNVTYVYILGDTVMPDNFDEMRRGFEDQHRKNTEDFEAQHKRFKEEMEAQHQEFVNKMGGVGLGIDSTPALDAQITEIPVMKKNQTAMRFVEETGASYVVDAEGRFQIYPPKEISAAKAKQSVYEDLKRRQENGDKLHPAEMDFLKQETKSQLKSQRKDSEQQTQTYRADEKDVFRPIVTGTDKTPTRLIEESGVAYVVNREDKLMIYPPKGMSKAEAEKSVYKDLKRRSGNLHKGEKEFMDDYLKRQQHIMQHMDRSR